MKKYLYEGNVYCDEDLSCDIDNYGGNLFDLYWELKKTNEAHENSYYYHENSDGKIWDSAAEMIEEDYEWFGIELVEVVRI